MRGIYGLTGRIRGLNRSDGTNFREISGRYHLSPLKYSNTGVDGGGDKGTPSRPAYRILCAVVAIISSLFISYRFLVLGDNWFKPDWLNILLLFAAFLCGVCGFAVLLKVVSDKFG